MKVLFLGAGTSIPAGYPSTAEIFSVIHEEIDRGTDVMIKNAWQELNTYLESADGIISRILNNPNPEVMLTLPDLYIAALESEEDARWRQLREALDKSDEDTIQELQKDLTSTERTEFNNARRIKIDILIILDFFFAFRHYLDFNPNSLTRRQYLHSLFNNLNREDVVITINWDTLAERTLMEEGRWVPGDGYGFPVILGQENILSFDVNQIENSKLPESSAVKVLKLHGSYGWKITDENIIYLESPGFLQYLPFDNFDISCKLKDKCEPTFAEPYNQMAIILPSFIKQIRGPQMQKIWHLASRALNEADEVTIIGCSLPDSDIGIRVLLNSLRYRCESRHCKVNIVNPNPGNCVKWQQFLGDSISVHQDTVEKIL